MREIKQEVMKYVMRELIVGRAIMMAMVAVTVLTLVIVFGSIAARSAQNDEAAKNKYYAVLEDEYEAALREYMNSEGFMNAGIMVTHIVDAYGNRTYTVKLHHQKFDRLDEGEKDELASLVAQMGFEDEICSFKTVFINR